ncbi:MAG TPA: peptidylprolyl isomerase [Syntrophobacteria bacterium]|nr:peptidylprolyl isomerase [Syntrophobacteria bacterium]
MFPPAFVEAAVVDRIIAYVNDDIITLSELDEKTAAIVAARKQNPYLRDQEQDVEKLRREILDNLINERLAAKEITRLKISVTAGEVDNILKSIMEDNNLTPEKFEVELRKEGLTVEDFRKRVQEDLERSKLIDREIRSKTVITDAQIEAYYQTHREEFQAKVRRRLQSIFLPFGSENSPDKQRQIYAMAEQILDRLSRGADFAAMAKRYSQGPGAESGGDLGFFNEGELDPVLEQAIETLKTGQVSQIVRTDSGLHIIRVAEVQTVADRPMEEVRENIRRRLFQQEINRKYAEWLKDLRDRSFVKIQL